LLENIICIRPRLPGKRQRRTGAGNAGDAGLFIPLHLHDQQITDRNVGDRRREAACDVARLIIQCPAALIGRISHNVSLFQLIRKSARRGRVGLKDIIRPRRIRAGNRRITALITRWRHRPRFSMNDITRLDRHIHQILSGRHGRAVQASDALPVDA
jgi:hypothetical protein